jgi:hypothetical protein
LPHPISRAEACGGRRCEALWDMGKLHVEVAARAVDAVLADLREGRKLAVAPPSMGAPLDKGEGVLRPWGA